MKAATIEWNGLDLSLIGKPLLTIRRTPEPAAPAQATRQVLNLTVSVELNSPDPSTLQARLEHLQRSMHASEGILASISPGGHRLEWSAMPSGDNLSEAITGQSSTVELNFSATEAYSQESINELVSASMTPIGGSTITLHAIRDYKEEIATERHSRTASARKLTTTSITFISRVMQTNPADSPADRMAALLAKQQELRAIDSRSATLVHAGLTRVVQVQSMTPKIDEARYALDLAIQCYHTTFPSSEKAECNLSIDTQKAEGANETIVTITGTIEADTEAIAIAKLDAIRDRHTTTGRRLTQIRSTPTRSDGYDTEVSGTATEEWSGSLAFSIEFREMPADTSRWNLKVVTSDNARGSLRTTYSGSVKASTAEAALTKARALGSAGGETFQIASEEVVETASAPGSEDSQLVGVTFSYEYEATTASYIFADITTSEDDNIFGDLIFSMNFSLTTASELAGLVFLGNVIGPTLLAITPLTRKITQTEIAQPDGSGVDRTTIRLEGSYTWPAERDRTAVKYTDEVNFDPSSVTQTHTINGTAWAYSKGNAESEVNSLITTILGGEPQQLRFSNHEEKWGEGGTGSASNRWVQLDFSASRTVKLTGTPGFDIIEAKCSIKRTGSISKTTLHEIPGDRPIAQTSICHTIPSVHISASCKARTLTAARAWCQNLRTIVNSLGTAGTTRHELSPPIEIETPDYEPFNGTTITLYVFSAEYHFGWSGGSITAMDGSWPASGFPSIPAAP